jgi:uncharacterized protein (TIGR04255 family)
MKQKMSKPPIFYALGRIKFNAILNMEEFIAKIQSELRQDYPDFARDIVPEVQIQMQGPGRSPTVNTVPSMRWNLTNALTTAAFSITQTSILFHTTEYEDSDALIGQMMRGLKVVHAHARLAYVESVAIRMLDAVIPSQPKEDLRSYLNPGPLGLHAIMKGKLTQSISQASFDTVAGQAVSRTVLLSGKLGFPQDLLPLILKINKRFAANGIHAILDNQCEKTDRISLRWESVEERIRSVKTQAAEPFWNSITDKAKEIWS